uniref:Recombination protein RecR n=1 Tax=uncultured myxobacterium HF0130_06F04 TaxID=723555 RepID=E7C2F6_9BACT|nr:recombinational DNA repair protein (recF pathway) [uncultured myxobacterium HF0130_06F04]
MSADPIERLILEMGRLPGIGERTAARLAFYLLKQARDAEARGLSTLARDLALALTEVVDEVRLCSRCQNLCASDLCSICEDTTRDERLLCVVENVSDLRALEASGAYRGTYHVLHGALAPLDGVGPADLKLPELADRVVRGGYQEVILAMNADVEGDATALYLARLLGAGDVKLSRLASGVPLGGELEYLDQATIGRALTARTPFES